jgi:protein SCO1/2
MNNRSSKFSTRLVAPMAAFLAGGKFPAFALCVLFFYQVLIAAFTFSPPATGVWGDLVEEFRIRCFQYNPASGHMEWGAAWMMLLEPLPMYLIFYFLWRSPLCELWASRRKSLLPLAGSAFLVVAAVGAGLIGFGRSEAREPARAFPAERLRSRLPMPDFALTDQDGQVVTPAMLKGKVVLLTAVYSTCTSTCPMILTRIRAVLDELSGQEQAQLVVLAFSLNPEQDTRELRTLTAQMYGMQAPQFHFVSGVPAEMEKLFDRLSVSRSRDEKTGAILHSNLFFLLDRAGWIAYRLSLSEHESSWLTAATRTLIKE